MSDDLFDEGAKRLFPEAWARVQAAQAARRIIPGTTRPRTEDDPTHGDVPGRTSPDRSRLATRDDHSPTWAKHPKHIGNRRKPFFTIGALAEALERSPITIRAWIREGWMPEAKYRRKTADARARCRYYTRAQIEGLVQLAHDERLLGTKRRNPGSTRFPQRAQDLFDHLAAEVRRTA